MSNISRVTPQLVGTRVRVIVLISGGGSNLKAIIQTLEQNRTSSTDSCPIELLAVIADRPALGLEYAKSRGFAIYMYGRKSNITKDEHFYDIDNLCRRMEPDIIVMAGFLGILPRWFTLLWSGKIINIHPTLLPKFGGKGMYGIKVHEAVLNAQETQSGCTVHWVIDEVDKGDIIAQKKVVVQADDTPLTLQARVLEAEHELYPQVLLSLANNIQSNKIESENIILHKEFA